MTRLTTLFLMVSFLLFSNQSADSQAVYAKHFEAKQMESGNALSWSTAQEKQTSLFVIERSADGLSFEMAARIPAAGYSNTRKNYQFLDMQMKGLRAFYRLIEIDEAGNSTSSDLLLVNKNIGGNDVFNLTRIKSMETSQFLTLGIESLYEDLLKINVQDYLGASQFEVDAELVAGMNGVSIDLSSLELGKYQMSLKVRNEIEVFSIRKTESVDAIKVPLAKKN